MNQLKEHPALLYASTSPLLPLVLKLTPSQIFFIAIPMQIEVAYLFGSWRKVIVLTILDTLLSIALVVAAAPFGLIWVAASRVVHGVI